MESAVESYDFVPTAAELRCLHDTSASKPPIPDVVHFTYALHPSGAELPFPAYLAIRAAILTLQPTTVKLHHTYLNPANEYVQRLLHSPLSTSIQLVHHDPISSLGGRDTQSWRVAHLSDVLRLRILHEEGGIYLDTDAFALRSFSPLRHLSADVVLGHEGGNRAGAANAVMLARPGAPFLARWMQRYELDFDPDEWNAHSVILPKQLAEEHPDEAGVLMPEAFFWPTWTETHVQFMHEGLGDGEVREVREAMEKNDGALYEGQFAYHAWSQMAWEKYLGPLTDERVRREDTRFNILVRRFLG